VANLNAPGQVVVAGGEADIAWAHDQGREFGVRRVIPLKVAGAFHSPLMASAADELAVALAAVAFETPRFPVYANVTARPVQQIAANLAQQLVSPVRFADGLTAMVRDGVEAFVHVGPGDVTAGMARRVAGDIPVHVVSTLEDVTPVAERLTVQ
jgi:[acyl-carrier-protein] S-malonyltransferase